MVPGQPREIVHETPSSENGLGSVARVIEHLLCKYEALSSNHSPMIKGRGGEVQSMLHIMYQN
jgi:hypothetical protein